MSSAVVSTSVAESRLFVFEEEIATHVGSAAHACPEPSRRGCPVEQSSTETHAAPSLPGVARHDSRGRLSPHGSLIQSHNQRFPPSSILPASQLGIRPAPEMASSGISALDALTGGLPRGCLTEICGSASSGRTTVLLAALAAATRRGEYCALLDASDALDPRSVEAAGVDLDRLLWVRCGEDNAGPSKKSAVAPPSSRTLRQGGDFDFPSVCPISRAPFAREACPEPVERVGISSQTALNFGETNSRAEHRLEQALRATDLLLESGGFGLIVLDLADLPPQSARRIPLTTWFRFRRAVEHKPTILLAIEQQPIAGSCSSLRLQLGVPSTQHPIPSSKPSHTNLLTELQIRTELVHSRLERKPSRSISFESKTAWAG